MFTYRKFDVFPKRNVDAKHLGWLELGDTGTPG